MTDKRALLLKTSKHCGLRLDDTRRTVDGFLIHLVEDILKQGKVRIVGFGTFDLVPVKPRIRHNPHHPGEKYMDAGGARIRFRPARQLRIAAKESSCKTKHSSTPTSENSSLSGTPSPIPSEPTSTM